MQPGLRVQVALISMALLAPLTARAEFPPGFLWGTAISGFQNEAGGTPVNADAGSDWWVWTHDPANISGGKVSGDQPEQGPAFYNLFAKDIALANKRLRSNALRLGIEWSRIFPTSTAGVDASGGVTLAVLQQLDALADQSAVAHYRSVLEELHARGMTPFVTMVHFTLPLWIHDPIAARDALATVGGNDPPPTGFGPAGWLEPAIVPEFEKYAAYLGWKFGDLVDFWTPLNEPMVVAVSGYVNIPSIIEANFPPGAFNFQGAMTTLLHEAEGQAAAYNVLKVWDTGDADGDGATAQVGLVHNMVFFRPKKLSEPLDIAGTEHADYLFNRLWLNTAIRGDLDLNVDGVTDPSEHHPDFAGKADFVGVNYYFRGTVAGIGTSLTPVMPLLDFLPTTSYAVCPSQCTDLGWEIYPDGLAQVVAEAGSYGLPVYITENGLADAADSQRASYVVQHLTALERAIANGADVRGYFHWSLIDNFEWAEGYAPKFGFFTFDPVKQRRVMRKSGRVFARIARKNTVPATLVERYRF